MEQSGNKLTPILLDADVGRYAIPNGVKTVKDSLFEETTNARSIVLSESVSRVDRWAFDALFSLSEILVDENNPRSTGFCSQRTEKNSSSIRKKSATNATSRLKESNESNPGRFPGAIR